MKQITCPHCGDTYPDFDVAHVCSKGPYAPKLKSKMNERIRELREQAWTLVSNEERDRGELYEVREQWERCDQKFAELIVKECVERASIGNGHGNNQWDRALTFAGKNIKEHFGVEE